MKRKLKKDLSSSVSNSRINDIYEYGIKMVQKVENYLVRVDQASFYSTCQLRKEISLLKNLKNLK